MIEPVSLAGSLQPLIDPFKSNKNIFEYFHSGDDLVKTLFEAMKRLIDRQ